jgi:hypothetical protein
VGARRAELEKLGSALKDLEATRDRKVCVLHHISYAVHVAVTMTFTDHVLLELHSSIAACSKGSVLCYTGLPEVLISALRHAR